MGRWRNPPKIDGSGDWPSAGGLAMRSWLRAVGYAQLAMRSWLCAVKAEREASLWRGELCPAGTGAFSLFIIWAAFAAASLLAEFWPPSRRAADGGLLGAAAPPRPPLHSPRTTPLGFPSSTNSLGSQQLPPKDNPARLSHFRQSARAARLLLRELPSLWSGDLPARRAMPSCAVALNGRLGPSGCLGRFGMS